MKLFIIKDSEAAAPKSALYFHEAGGQRGVEVEYVYANSVDHFPYQNSKPAMRCIGSV